MGANDPARTKDPRALGAVCGHRDRAGSERVRGAGAEAGSRAGARGAGAAGDGDDRRAAFAVSSDVPRRRANTPEGGRWRVRPRRVRSGEGRGGRCESGLRLVTQGAGGLRRAGALRGEGARQDPHGSREEVRVREGLAKLRGRGGPRGAARRPARLHARLHSWRLRPWRGRHERRRRLGSCHTRARRKVSRAHRYLFRSAPRRVRQWVFPGRRILCEVRPRQRQGAHEGGWGWSSPLHRGRPATQGSSTSQACPHRRLRRRSWRGSRASSCPSRARPVRAARARYRYGSRTRESSRMNASGCSRCMKWPPGTVTTS